MLLRSARLSPVDCQTTIVALIKLRGLFIACSSIVAMRCLVLWHDEAFSFGRSLIRNQRPLSTIASPPSEPS